MHTLEQLRSGALAGTRRLDLSAGLDTFPPEIFSLADTLEVLNLSGNQLDRLPDDLPRLKHLKVIFASGNPFTELPPVLGDCPALEMVGFKGCRIRDVPAEALPAPLRWLILTDNAVETLPAALGRREQLQKLMLAGNRLQQLPDLSGCERLELLRLAANRFETLPPGLTELPRLSWLALAGNPLWAAQAGTHARPDIPRIDWHALALEHELGRGASGVIHHARWQPPQGGTARPVAVKLFHAAMTSDGLPDCEMAACVAAAGHPDLIDVAGVLQNHPDGSAGLVLELLDPTFRTLAGPPSLASCTRDVYADGLTLPAEAVLHLARHSAVVMAHLHAQSLLHGDFYAHNLLWNGDPHAPACRLSDFGAATFIDLSDPHAAALQRLEVRAWGCLAEELLDHAADPLDATLAPLAALRDACLQPQVRQRPSFATIADALGATSSA